MDLLDEAAIYIFALFQGKILYLWICGGYSVHCIFSWPLAVLAVQSLKHLVAGDEVLEELCGHFDVEEGETSQISSFKQILGEVLRDGVEDYNFAIIQLPYHK